MKFSWEGSEYPIVSLYFMFSEATENLGQQKSIY